MHSRELTPKALHNQNNMGVPRKPYKKQAKSFCSVGVRGRKNSYAIFGPFQPDGPDGPTVVFGEGGSSITQYNLHWTHYHFHTVQPVFADAVHLY